MADRDGRYADGDRHVFERAAVDGVVLPPAENRAGWIIDPDLHEAVEIAPDDDRFILRLFTDVSGRLTKDDLDRVDSANFLSVSGAGSLDEAVQLLSSDFAQLTAIESPTFVLIDRDGSPTFASGLRVHHEQLAAMERTRRNGAPMASWQAFTENRLTTDPNWFDVTYNDARFGPISAMIPKGYSGTYVSIPMRVDGRPVGVLSGVVLGDRSVGPFDVFDWSALADRMMLAIRYSEALRRSRAHGANAERSRVHERLHATVAQDAFVLSLELARVNTTLDEDLRSRLGEVLPMSDQLLATVRAVIEEQQDGESGAGVPDRLQQLADDARTRSGAMVRINDDVRWDVLSSAFAEEIVSIAAEGIRNALKHGQPDEIVLRVTMAQKSGWLELTIRDRSAAHADRPESTGVGLNLVRRLVQPRGGRADVTLGPEGALFRVIVPAEFESEWAVARRSLDAPREL